MQKLKKLLQQRDAEIEILTQMVGGDQPKKKPAEKGPQYDYNEVNDAYEDSADGTTNEIKFVKENSYATDKESSHPQSAKTDQKPTPRREDSQQQMNIAKPPKPKNPQEQYMALLSSAENICVIDL